MPCYQRKIKKGVRWFYKGSYLRQNYHSKAIYLTKKECATAERAKINELDKKARSINGDIGIKDLFNQRLDNIQTNKSKKYYEENRRFFQMFLDFTKKQMVSEISKADGYKFVNQFSADLKKEGKDNFKVNAAIRVLKAAFNEAIDIHEVNMRNPFKIKFFPVKIQTKHIPSQADIDKVKKISNPEQRLLIDFVDQTACRIMEAIRLDFEEINGEQLTLYTRKSKNSNFTPRIIPLPDCLKNVKGTGKVFSWTDYPHFVGEKAKSLKIKRWNWHSLRHRRASIWANNGMSLIELQYRLGHSNMETTQKYLQLLGFTKS